MTDDEIMKALERCGDEFNMCSDCPYFLQDKDNDFCREDMCKDTVDLINRLQAENEKNENIIRLADKTIETANAEIDLLNKTITENAQRALEVTVEEIDKAKTEVIKEFAERLKTETFLAKAKGSVEHILWMDEIDNLVKEMTEGKNDFKEGNEIVKHKTYPLERCKRVGKTISQT